jgi:hypothetical protein
MRQPVVPVTLLLKSYELSDPTHEVVEAVATPFNNMAAAHPINALDILFVNIFTFPFFNDLRKKFLRIVIYAIFIPEN